MRNISAATLAALQQPMGLEPVNIVEIQWIKDGPWFAYADKTIVGTEVKGRILSIDTFEDVINISNNGTSQSVSITLNDADGVLKNIFNQNDIHRKNVRMYQWFTTLPYNEKFVLFTGRIASPVTWKEGDRTLTFTVISQSEDREVGFSPEEGQFSFLPQGIVGQAWPLVFGRVSGLQAILIDDIPYSDSSTSGDAAGSLLTEGTGIEDPSLDPQIKNNNKQMEDYIAFAEFSFVAYLIASYNARKRGELDEFDSIDKGKGQWSGVAKQYLANGNKALLEAQKVRRQTDTLTTVQRNQQQNQKKVLKVSNGAAFPQGVETAISIAGARHEGVFVGDTFVVNKAVHPDAEKFDGYTQPDRFEPGTPSIPRQTYFYADAGTPLKLNYVVGGQDAETLSVRYIVAATIQVTVEAVYAYRTVDGIRYYTIVPSNYYSVLQVNFGSLPVTMLFLRAPLSSLGLGYDDDLYVTCRSSVGPNTVDIVKWLIESYTDRTYDATSFASVRTKVSPFPMNFALTDRPTVLSLLSDLAYQARCIIWLKNDVFYIKYLASADTPIATLTEADVLENTMEVSLTETEDLVTKYVASWKATCKQTKDWLVILRYNVKYYGVLEKKYDFFAYNQQQLVEKSATFWLIREGNTFKEIKIVVPIANLKIETLDTVTLDFSGTYIANGPVNCVVKECKINTENFTMDLLLWVPVRAGEMKVYDFAYPGDLGIQYVFPTEEDIQSGRAGSGPSPSPVAGYNDNVTMPEDSEIGRNMSGDPANGGVVVLKRERPATWGGGAGVSDSGATAPSIYSRLDPSAMVGTGKKPEGTTQYQYQANKAVDTSKVDTVQPRTYPGFVLERGEDVDGRATYSVRVFQEGLGRSGKISDVIYVGKKDDVIPEGTGVIITETFYVDSEGRTETTRYMQVSSGSGNKIYPAFVKEGDNTAGYTVEAYPEGLEKDPVTITEVFMVDISSADDEIAVDTPAFVVEISSTNEADEPITLYYMQVPTWQ